ncbi:25084_t:CDS:2, partial [Racocetra persica]
RANLQKLHIFPDTLQNNLIHQEYYQNEENCYYLPVADSLTGTLDLSSLPRLRKLTINQQFINRLILTGCQQLRELDADGNLLRKVILPLRAHRLKSIRLNDNNFWARDLNLKLEELDINATDINGGLEYLNTEKLFGFTFGNCGRTGARVDELKDALADFLELQEGKVEDIR